jgi:CBS domain-containing protein
MVKVFTTEGNSDVGKAVMIMKEKGVGCLPVIEDNSLVGIISERDVLKLF